MRICHWIKPNARSESPTRAIWFQAWTYETVRTPYQTDYDFEFIRICRGNKDTNTGTWSFTWHMVLSASEFWHTVDWLTFNKTKIYMICDNPNLHLPLISAFHQTILQGWKLTLAVIPPAPTICRWRKGTKNVTMLGASNIWPTPSSITCNGKTECSHFENDGVLNGCDHVKLIDSSIAGLRDKTIAWWKFLKANDFGGFSATAGAQSYRTWRHKFMTHRVLIDCHDYALTLAREAIYGARCEIRSKTVAAGPIYELDANGSYGGVMRDMRVPVKLISYRKHCTIRDVCDWIRDYVCIARVTVTSEHAVYPVHVNRRLAFVTGRFETVLAGAELEYALEHGDVIDIDEAAVYEHAPAFDAYMQALWFLRKSSETLNFFNDAEKYKLLMASFWGRWAQKGRVWEKVGDVSSEAILSWVDINADTGELTEWRQFGGIVQKLNNDEESRESHPAIAACILAGGRMQLWKWMCRARLDHVYYVNTDSLFTDEMGRERLRDDIKPDELGKLRIKGVYDRATFLSEKHIIVDGQVRHAGVSWDAVLTREGVIHQTQSYNVGAWIRRGQRPQASTKEVTKGGKV